MLPILQAGHPLIFGETGETYDSSDCGSSYISTFIGWADAHGVGYEPWTWDTWGGCGVLISDYNGTAANAYGSWGTGPLCRARLAPSSCSTSTAR